MTSSPHRQNAPYGPWLAWLVNERLRVLRRELRILAEGAETDAEAVHRLRVAARRLRNALGMARWWSGRRRFRRRSQRLGRIARAFGALRDLDVQALFLDRLARHEERRLRPVFRRLARRLRGQRRRLARGLAGLLSETRAWSRRIGADTYRLATGRQGGRTDGDAWRKALARSLHRRWTAYRTAAETALAAPDDGALHRWRIAAKKLRYRLEALTSLLGGDHPPPQAVLLAALQGHLGEAHDAAGFAAMLPGLGRDEAADARRRGGRRTPLPWLKLGVSRALARNAFRHRCALRAARHLHPVIVEEQA